MDDEACNFNNAPSGNSTIPCDGCCLYEDCAGGCYCSSSNWETFYNIENWPSASVTHNTDCVPLVPSNAHYLDNCGNCLTDTNDPQYDDCTGCSDPEAVNYNPSPSITTSVGCMYGDLEIIPHSTRQSNTPDSYIFRPVGNDSTGTQCVEDVFNQGNYTPVDENGNACNVNYGGWVTDQGGIISYQLIISQNPNFSSIFFMDNVTLSQSGETGMGVSLECPDFYQTGMYSFQTFINCGFGKKLYVDGLYYIKLIANDSYGRQAEVIKELDVQGTINIDFSIVDNFLPYQGINIPDNLLNNQNESEYTYNCTGTSGSCSIATNETECAQLVADGFTGCSWEINNECAVGYICNEGDINPVCHPELNSCLCGVNVDCINEYTACSEICNDEDLNCLSFCYSDNILECDECGLGEDGNTIISVDNSFCNGELNCQNYYDLYGSCLDECIEAVAYGAFDNTEQWFELADLDKRPSLGTFWYSDSPNSLGLSDAINLDDDGYYLNYYMDKKTVSGVKWGGNNGIGKALEGSMPNIEQECGVDRGIVTQADLIHPGVEAGTNDVCLSIVDMGREWIPDCQVITGQSDIGRINRLMEYYDPTLQVEKYQDTTGPIQADFYFSIGREIDNIFDYESRSGVSLSEWYPVYLYNIDWGDGKKSYESKPFSMLSTDGYLSHQYDDPGIYEIKGYIFSLFRHRQCGKIENDEVIWNHDGKNHICTQDSHCYGRCVNEVCDGGTNHGTGCTDWQDCADGYCPTSWDVEDTAIKGVDRFFEFTIKININMDEEYPSHPFVLNQGQNSWAQIGGFSKNSMYYKSIKRNLGYTSESSQPANLIFKNIYDKVLSEYALAQQNENLIGDTLKTFKKDYFDGDVDADGVITNEELIYNARFLKHHGTYGKHLTEFDLGQFRLFNVGNLGMSEILGFDDISQNNPNEDSYWKNIIPENYTISDREGISYHTCSQLDLFEPQFYIWPTCEYVGQVVPGEIDELSSQEWLPETIDFVDDFGNIKYSQQNIPYYPVLPKLNRFGKFDYDNLGYQGNKQIFGSLETNDVNKEFRLWDELDEFSLVTYKEIGLPLPYDTYLLIDLDFESVTEEKSQDNSGNNNDGNMTGDYLVEFEDITKEPEKGSDPFLPIIGADEKDKPY